MSRVADRWKYAEVRSGREEDIMRLTKLVRELLLVLNEGFTTTTHYSGKNFTEDRTYRIADGELHIHSEGKGSWADSRFDKEWVADDKETHRFLYDNLGSLDTDEIGVSRRCGAVDSQHQLRGLSLWLPHGYRTPLLSRRQQTAVCSGRPTAGRHRTTLGSHVSASFASLRSSVRSRSSPPRTDAGPVGELEARRPCSRQQCSMTTA